MGLCASQARLLMLTARKSDLEFRRMQISNAKQMLAMQTEMVAKKQSEALGNMKTQVKTANNGYQDLSLASLMSAEAPNGKPKFLVMIKGADNQNYLVTTKDANEGALANSGNGANIEYNGEKRSSLASGGTAVGSGSGQGDRVILVGENQNGINTNDYNDHDFFMQEYNKGNIIILQLTESGKDSSGNPTYSYVPCNPGSTAGFDETYDTSDDALAEAEYTREMARIKVKEQALDLESQQIETQHSAVSTEIESVQNLVKKNSETSFKYFS